MQGFAVVAVASCCIVAAAAAPVEVRPMSSLCSGGAPAKGTTGRAPLDHRI